MAYVEDTSERTLEDPEPGPLIVEPRLILEIADCSNRISLEFEIDSALRRKNSFHKIDTLIDVLVAFRAGLPGECRLYVEREAERQREAEAEGRFSPTPAPR